MREAPAEPRSILVVRNNDIGDLLVVTPLFEALRKRFRGAAIVAGIGDWNRPVLEGNPFVDAVVCVNAPWHNGVVRPQGLVAGFRYLLGSSEIGELRRRGFDIGIDVLGSGWGSLLLILARIRYRMGVDGYAGGGTAASARIKFRADEHVGRMALRFAETLGLDSRKLPEPRPQIYLTDRELEEGRAHWRSERRRMVIAPGGGFKEKCWEAENFRQLAEACAERGWETVVIGGANEVDLGACVAGKEARNLAGQLKLRETFALIAGADHVVCNSSMAMHAAAAFRVPATVMLGRHFESVQQHVSQWGYPEQRTLGGPISVSVEEVIAAIDSEERFR